MQVYEEIYEIVDKLRRKKEEKQDREEKRNKIFENVRASVNRVVETLNLTTSATVITDVSNRLFELKIDEHTITFTEEEILKRSIDSSKLNESYLDLLATKEHFGEPVLNVIKQKLGSLL